jgi:predicted small lipoprotein YifL
MTRRGFSLPAALLVLAFLAPLALAGCGKKNPPRPPPGVPNTYPRTYPSA